MREVEKYVENNVHLLALRQGYFGGAAHLRSNL